MIDLHSLKKRLISKVRCESGESLPEVLVGMLIACMATVALVTMTMSASASAAKTREASQDVWNQETAIARTTPSAAGQAGSVSASISTGSISVSAGSVTKSLDASVYKTSDFTYYEVAQSSKVVSSQEVDHSSSSDGGEGGGK